MEGWCDFKRCLEVTFQSIAVLYVLCDVTTGKCIPALCGRFLISVFQFDPRFSEFELLKRDRHSKDGNTFDVHTMQSPSDISDIVAHPCLRWWWHHHQCLASDG